MLWSFGGWLPFSLPFTSFYFQDSHITSSPFPFAFAFALPLQNTHSWSTFSQYLLVLFFNSYSRFVLESQKSSVGFFSAEQLGHHSPLQRMITRFASISSKVSIWLVGVGVFAGNEGWLASFLWTSGTLISGLHLLNFILQMTTLLGIFMVSMCSGFA
jgi:hypothetical protein